MVDLLEIKMNDFQGCLNDLFRIHLDENQSLQFKLIEAKELSNFNQDKGKPFSLLFSSEEKGILPQQVYTIEHSQLGNLDVFLVPIGSDEKSINYEAIFT